MYGRSSQILTQLIFDTPAEPWNPPAIPTQTKAITSVIKLKVTLGMHINSFCGELIALDVFLHSHIRDSPAARPCRVPAYQLRRNVFKTTRKFAGTPNRANRITFVSSAASGLHFEILWRLPRRGIYNLMTTWRGAHLRGYRINPNGKSYETRSPRLSF